MQPPAWPRKTECKLLCYGTTSYMNLLFELKECICISKRRSTLKVQSIVQVQGLCVSSPQRTRQSTRLSSSTCRRSVRMRTLGRGILLHSHHQNDYGQE